MKQRGNILASVLKNRSMTLEEYREEALAFRAKQEAEQEQQDDDDDDDD